MAYVANTDADRRAMLESIGVNSVADLFKDIPEKHRFPDLEIPPPLSELDVTREIEALAERNRRVDGMSFLGGGAWNHFIPRAVPNLASRAEFATAYTPYQPEASQGTLQAMFEYQSMLCELTGMEVVNASHYDGATSVAEAALMAYNAARGKRKKILVSGGLHPQYRQVMQTYLQAMEVELTALPSVSGGGPGGGPAGGPAGGAADPRAADRPAGTGSHAALGTAAGAHGTRASEAFHAAGGSPQDPACEAEFKQLAAAADDDTACVIVQNPDFFGRMTSLAGLAEELHAKGVLLVVHTDPIYLGLARPPGADGADIVTGEGQPLGIDLSFGGPYLGIFATTKKLVRRMPGRLVGQTVDAEGNRGFVLTLNTREQHIRREKATSNICTNQGLMALRAAIYLALMGPAGLREVASLCYHKSHYAAAEIDKLKGCSVPESNRFFKEFVVDLPRPAAEVVSELAEQGIAPGLDLGRYFQARRNQLLVAVTEMNTRDDIDALVTALESVTQ